MADRRHAATNPHAWFHGRPITLEDHQASRWIVEPLRLLDCCQESDGGVALVVTTVDAGPRPAGRAGGDRARRRRAAAPTSSSMTSYYRDDLTGLPEMGVVARQLWAQSGSRPTDVRWRCSTTTSRRSCWSSWRSWASAPRGEARHFIADGALELDGRLPLNPHGGQLGEAYIHGMNGIAEAVRQIRGTAVNQVAARRHVLVTAGTGVPTSGLILTP